MSCESGSNNKIIKFWFYFSVGIYNYLGNRHNSYLSDRVR